jgi:N-acetylmuramoyl-L-alanine amidase
LAQRAVNGERHHPASNALWFFRPAGACPPRGSTRLTAGATRAIVFIFPITPLVRESIR